MYSKKFQKLLTYELETLERYINFNYNKNIITTCLNFKLYLMHNKRKRYFIQSTTTDPIPILMNDIRYDIHILSSKATLIFLEF